MVCTRCFTYNQAAYIEDAMRGFTMQVTSFPVVYVIVDDASTDGEPTVIKNYLAEKFYTPFCIKETEYAHIISANHKTNNNCRFVVLLLKYNHYQKKSKLPYISEWVDNSKYTALNEGDDYWIDPEKLQKQVDFMESHPQHSLCFCTYQNLFPDGRLVPSPRYEHDVEDCPIEDVILAGGGYAATNAMLYRNKLYGSYTTWVINPVVGDLPMTLTLAVQGKIGYLHDLMCVYRCNASGSWSRRMASSFRYRRKTYLGIKRIMRLFDDWTEKKYHSIVKKKLKNNTKQYIISELRYLKYRLL